MKFRHIAIFYAIFSLVILSSVTICAENGSAVSTFHGGTLRVSAVQFSVHADVYKSEAVFSRKIENLVSREMRIHNPDLIIFPEYTSVFLALMPYIGKLNYTKGYTDEFKMLKTEYPDIKTVKSLFLKEGNSTFSIMQSVFGRLAGEYHVYILAGTYFAPSIGSSIGSGSKLHNRAVVFGPNGKVVYSQNKVFLTDFERDIIGLSSGKLAKAKGFLIKGKRIALSICRDTYEPVWEDKFKNYDLWIDIKANGTGFDKQQQQSFLRALPGRIVNTNVKYGITDCLTGKLFDLYWEGESSFIENNNAGIRAIKRSKSYNDEETIFSVLSF